MLIPLNVKHSLIVAKLHQKALYGDFLPSLGIGFLKAFYEGIIGKQGVYGFVHEEKGRVDGFVLGAKNSEKLFSQALRANLIKLTFLLLLQLIKRPNLIKNILETFLYTKKEAGPKAELVIIAVGKNTQGKGVGKQLVHELESGFKKSNIREYKLTVHADKKAVGFYEHLGYSRISSFKLYGKMWFVYEKKISP